MFNNVGVFICTKMLMHSCRQRSACFTNISRITFCKSERIDYIRVERSRYSISDIKLLILKEENTSLMFRFLQ